MANEKNGKVSEGAVATEAAKAAAEAKKCLIVEREKFVAKDGREMWGYAVHGNVRGRETKVDFDAYDKGGYEVLDMIFDIRPFAELEMREESMLDNETGEVRSFTVYTVGNVDEEGDVISCRVKPARNSDKSILDYLLKKLNRQSGTDKPQTAA